MTEDYILADDQRQRCERELERYRSQWLTLEEHEIQRKHDDPLDAGIEIGFKAAWAYMSRLLHVKENS